MCDFGGRDRVVSGMKINEGYLALLENHINDVIYDKKDNALGDWIADYGAVVNDDMRVIFGSHLSLQMMLERRDKEVIRIVLQQLIIKE